jgi:type IV secretory pathway VirB3-like protein
MNRSNEVILALQRPATIWGIKKWMFWLGLGVLMFVENRFHSLTVFFLVACLLAVVALFMPDFDRQIEKILFFSAWRRGSHYDARQRSERVVTWRA